LIQKLSDGDGYFSDTFHELDVKVMIANITNDFPLLTGTEVNEKIVHAADVFLENERLRQKIEDSASVYAEYREKVEKREITFKKKLEELIWLCLNNSIDPSKVVGAIAVIRVKLLKGFPLNEPEIELVNERL